MKVVFITGSPGVGKTTVAARLSAALHGRRVNLGQLARREGFLLGYDKLRRCPIVDLDKVGSYLRRVVEEGGMGTYLVVEGHFLVKLPRRLVKRVFLLRCHPLELRRRLARKGYGVQKVSENLWAEILDYSLIEALDLYDSGKVHEIDTTGRSAGEVVKEMLAVLRGEQKPAVGRFDWLKVLEAERKLDELLAEGEMLQ